MIELKNLSKIFAGSDGQDVKAVDQVSLTVHEGETVCLIGTSGSGKTTCMKMINRLIEPTSGQILLSGEDVQTLDPIRLRRRIGYVIQKAGLLPHLTVAQNIGLLCKLENWPKPKTLARVKELLALVNMEPEKYLNRYPSELSGGQQQRVGVARALALDAKYILMDEPFGALDPITREGLHEEFLRLKNEVQKTIIIVTHDLSEAFHLGDRIALMSAGRLVQIGTEDDFRYRPANDFVEEFVSQHVASLSLTVASALIEGECCESDAVPVAVTAPLRVVLSRLLRNEKTEWPVIDESGDNAGKVTIESVLKCLS